MSDFDDWKKTVRRNKLLGMWAAEKLGIKGAEAEAYSDALAMDTLDNEFTLLAGSQMPATPGGAVDALTVMLARKLKPE